MQSVGLLPSAGAERAVLGSGGCQRYPAGGCQEGFPCSNPREIMNIVKVSPPGITALSGIRLGITPLHIEVSRARFL